jgi:hypothetical protein
MCCLWFDFICEGHLWVLTKVRFSFIFQFRFAFTCFPWVLLSAFWEWTLSSFYNRLNDISKQSVLPLIFQVLTNKWKRLFDIKIDIELTDLSNNC